MSTYTSSITRPISTQLDEMAQSLGSSRLEEESLFDFKQRLIDLTINRPNSSVKGMNFGLGRQLGSVRKHAFTLEAISGTDPLIVVSSKYIKIYNGTDLEFQLDLYSNTFGALYSSLLNSDVFEMSYYDDAYEDFFLKKMFYGSNIKTNSQYLTTTKANILANTFIKDMTLDSTIHIRAVDSLSDVVSPKDWYLDYENGVFYSGSNGQGRITYSYYETPHKLYYCPVTFFPLGDEDIDLVIKEPILTDDGTDYIINSKGAAWINELLSVSPLTWGK